MAKRIILNAFDMTCVSHQSSGTWRHPESQAHRYKDLDYWTDLAQTLEKGCFDAIFIADVLGTYDVYRDSVAPSLREAAQTPVNDPFFQVPAMAAVTKHLGFGITSATTYDQPFYLARKFATLDHLTKGRVAWNVVSSYLNSAAINLGYDKQLAHADRYEIADEFIDVTYKLWEGSWEEDAVVFDRERGVYADPEKIHPIHHEGKYFKVPGIAITEPSPQRTPVIFQAGASPRGQKFAAKHGEGIFISPASVSGARIVSDSIRDRAEEAGRSRDDVKIFALLTVIVDETDEKAQAKFQDYLSYASPEGVLALYGGWTGLDFSQLAPETELEAVENDSLRSVLASLTTLDPDRKWTVGDVIEQRAIGGMGPVVVGSPTTVADELERWVDEGGIDGFNFGYAVAPGSFEDLVEFVVPELQRRGRAQTKYTGSTLREALYGEGETRVKASHPAAKYRGAYANAQTALDGTLPSRFDASEQLAHEG